MSSQLTTNTARHMEELSAAVSVSSIRAQGMIHGLAERMAAMGATDPTGAARKAFQFMISREAQVLAFADGFALMVVGCLAAACVALLANPGPIQQQWGAAPRPQEGH
jgi:DHA2 family multidrug resistance protein